MFQLIQNERMKIWAKKGSWIMLALLVLAIVGYGILSNSIASDSSNWKADEQSTIAANKEMLDEEGIDETTKKDLEETIAISQYRLDNNVAPLSSESVQGHMQAAPYFMMFVLLFVVIVAGGIVSSEFSKGTIKMLLTRPVSRFKILLSKLLAVVEFAVLLSIVTIVLNYIVALLFFGNATGANLIMDNGQVTEVNIWKNIFMSFGFQFIAIIMSMLFAFMLGVVFRSSSLAIGLTIFISLLSTTITLFLTKYEFIKFIWFAVQDLEGIYHGQGILDVSFPFAIMIQIIYAIIFLVIAFITFMKSDITA
ncbi:ABC transporter permease [Kurthia populi]|uniref:ABC transporter permease n=1 Tax=Kurthia populi TaxID=1562132 RepID=A0ABW5Y3X6_9BACL